MRHPILLAAVVFVLTRSAAAQAPDIRIEPATVTFGTVVSASQMRIASDERPVRGSARPARGSSIDELEKKARRDGTVHVIAQISAREHQQGVAHAAGVADARTKRFDTIPFVAMEVDANQLRRLAALPDVIDVQEDVVTFATLASSNTVIGTGAAWAAGFGGAGQTVAILDTGVDASHPFFNGKVVSEACYSTNGGGATSLCPGGVSSSIAPGSGRNCPNEIFGCFHGTHVAGIAAGNDGIGPNFGVARDAKVIAIQVFSLFDASECSTGAPCIGSFLSDQVRALERVLALRNDFHIAAANMSLGGGFTVSNATFCDFIASAEKAAIDNLRAAGIATVIAAGNNSSRVGLSLPGCISSAISAGATDDADNVASFSNVSSFVSLLAPGVNVTSAVPGGGTAHFNGTSMAAPHVTGMWALMRQANPTADVSTILAMLREGGTIVNDNRSGGTITNMRRINAASVYAPSTRTFTIYNDGALALYVASINRLTEAPWITWTPAAPFMLQPGASQTITVSIDLAAAPVGQTTTRLIVDSNDPDESPYPDGVNIVVTKAALPAVTIAASDATATELGATTGTFVVTRTGSTTAPLTVGYYLGGTASVDTDYAPLTGNVTIPAGASSATITLTPIDDTLVEPDETAIAGVASSSAYIIGAANSATVTIASDDTLGPANVVATATTPASVSVSWSLVNGATSYRVYRNSGAGWSLVGSPAAPPFSDTSVAANTAYLYKVHSFDGLESGDSNVDLATTVIFTDPDPIGTPVRATHFAEVLTAINALRAFAGAGPIGAAPAAGSIVGGQLNIDLRTYLNAARNVMGLPSLTFTDATIFGGITPIRAVHLTELRNGVK